MIDPGAEELVGDLRVAGEPREARIELFADQLAALTSPGSAREMLVKAEPRSGASHLLRVMAIAWATQVPGVRVVIAPSTKQSVREDHMEGAGGMWKLVAPLVEHGAAKWGPFNTLYLQSRSTIRVAHRDIAIRLAADVILLDDADDLGWAKYSTFRDTGLAGSIDGALPRLVVVSKRHDTGWAKEQWPRLERSCQVTLRASAIPEALRILKVAPPRLTLKKFMDLSRPGMIWHRHTEILVEACQRVLDREILRLMIFAPPRHGKALRFDTPIPTPSGWTAIGDLKTGDEVFAGDGSVTTVVATARWRDRPVYRVTSDDGASVMADADHDWLVRLCRKGKHWKVRNTGYLAARSCQRSPLIPAGAALQTGEAELPIPPYTLGAWLGDGASLHANMTSGDDDRDWMRAQIEADGFVTRKMSSRYAFGILGLHRLLGENGLRSNKHIPEAYMRASVSQRMALLQGLIDTDGHVSPDGQIEFCNTNERLAKQVQELVHGLGRKASLIVGRAMLYGKDCGPKFRVMFYMAGAARLPRKADKCRDSECRPGRFLHFEPAGNADTACIQVAHPSQLFLAGKGCLVTHNSLIVSRSLIPCELKLRPENWGGLASATARLAVEMAKDARSQYRESGGAFREDSQNAAIWRTDRGGGMWAIGVGGGILGMGANLLVVDDPFKSRLDAESQNTQEKVWSWFRGDFRSRRHLGGDPVPIVLMHQRLAEGDLAGRSLDLAEKNTEEGWVVLNMPAIKRPRTYVFPSNCTVIEDDRAEGEALCEAMMSKDELRVEEEADALIFAALYQQEPRSTKSGGMFSREWWPRLGEPEQLRDVWAAADDLNGVIERLQALEVLPKFKREARAWDYGAGKDGTDATASVRGGLSRADRVVVTDCRTYPIGSAKVEQTIFDQAVADGFGVEVLLPQDPNTGGKVMAENIASTLREAGYKVTIYVVAGSGSKRARATPHAGAATPIGDDKVGRVSILWAKWNDLFCEQHHRFTGLKKGETDDVVDAMSTLYNALRGIRTRPFIQYRRRIKELLGSPEVVEG